MNAIDAICFLNEAAKYFEKRPTEGEDRAHWSNVYNAENCRKIARLIVELEEKVEHSRNPEYGMFH